MRIGVMAAGAVGGYFGGRLVAAGHDVVFFARGKNLEALRRNGLKIESVKGDLHLPKVDATDGAAATAKITIVRAASTRYMSPPRPLKTPAETHQTGGTISWARARENVTGSRRMRHKSDFTGGRVSL